MRSPGARNRLLNAARSVRGKLPNVLQADTAPLRKMVSALRDPRRSELSSATSGSRRTFQGLDGAAAHSSNPWNAPPRPAQNVPAAGVLSGRSTAARRCARHPRDPEDSTVPARLSRRELRHRRREHRAGRRVRATERITSCAPGLGGTPPRATIRRHGPARADGAANPALVQGAGAAGATAARTRGAGERTGAARAGRGRGASNRRRERRKLTVQRCGATGRAAGCGVGVPHQQLDLGSARATGVFVKRHRNLTRSRSPAGASPRSVHRSSAAPPVHP